VINLPNVISPESELYCRSWASRKSGGAERSGQRALQKNDGAGGRGAGGYRNWLERGAAFSPLTLRSLALLGSIPR